MNTIEELALEYAPLLRRGQHFSHLTAAALLGLRLPEGQRHTALHVATCFPHRAPRSAGVTGHQFAVSRATVTIRGIPVSTPVDTWCDLATILTVDSLIVMGDGLLRRKHPLATLDELSDAVAARAGRRGHRRLCRALPELRSRTDSGRETLLRLIIVRSGLPEPEVNGEIRNSFGVVIAHGDLVFREYRTVVEYDGGQHREDELQFHIDIDRLDGIMAERWRVIRVDKRLMANRGVMLHRIETALRDGGWTGRLQLG